jgi:GNAT superfamily N-acetyltransferase
MQIRKIESRDLEACAKILEQAYSKAPYNEVFQESSALRYIEGKYKNCGEHSFVAVNDQDEVLGFIFLNISSWTDGLQAILEEIVVDVNLQGTGVGKLLMIYSNDYLKSLGAKSLMLWAKNDSQPIDFYKKNGYEPAEDFVVMFKNFGE